MVDPTSPSGRARAASEPYSPTRGSPSRISAGSLADREYEELQRVAKHPQDLEACVSEAIKSGTLEDTATLETLSSLSQQLLTRNHARTAASKYAKALIAEKEGSAGAASLDTALAALYPSYFRHTPFNEEEGQSVWTSKSFLRDLPGAEGIALCVRFTVTEQRSLTLPIDDEDEEEEEERARSTLYDLSLKVMQINQLDGKKFTCSYGMQDVSAAAAADAATAALDEALRGKLNDLRALLGLSTRWTSIGVLGLLLASAGCGSMDELSFFCEVCRACREAHRAELLADAGNLF